MLISRYAPDNWSIRLMRLSGFIFLLLSVPVGLFMIVSSMLPISIVMFDSSLERLLFGLFGVAFMIQAARGGAGLLVTSSDISLEPSSSLTVHYSLFLRKTLPIELIATARRTPASVPRYHLSPLAALNRNVPAFEIRGLPFIHRLAGLYYRAGFQIGRA